MHNQDKPFMYTFFLNVMVYHNVACMLPVLTSISDYPTFNQHEIFKFTASGFLLRNLGCPSPTELSSSALSRHDCAVACLSSSDCVSFSFHHTLDPQMCKLHSDSCEAGTVADVHTYNKGNKSAAQS